MVEEYMKQLEDIIDKDEYTLSNKKCEKGRIYEWGK